MKYDHQKDRRHSIRLRDYNYGWPGAYFVTICTQNRQLLFEDDSVKSIAEQCWLEIPSHFPTAELDEWVVMPNHLHGIIVIPSDGRDVQLNVPTSARKSDNPFSLMSPHRNTLAVIVRTYKASVTRECRLMGYSNFGWQRNYYEHVIRTDAELDRIRRYIAENPLKWELDEYNPNRRGV